MKKLTYAGWREIGYQVKAGEESTSRNAAGEPVFSRDQVDDAPVRDTPAPAGFGDDEDWG